MKFTTVITTAAILSDTASAFTLNPRAQKEKKTSIAANKVCFVNTIVNIFVLMDTDRFVPSIASRQWNSDNAKNALDDAGDMISRQADKVPEYLDEQRVLLFDTNRTKKRLAQNWGWILTEGTLQVAVGMFALLAPALAISITAIQQSFLLIAIGATNVFSSLFVEDGFKLRNVLLGASQVLLGYLLSVDPYDFALATTIGVAASAFLDGGFRALTALRNKDLPDRGWLFTGGVVSILGSQLIWSHINEPLAVLGTLLGIKFISSGASRIRAGLTGQAIANGKK